MCSVSIYRKKGEQTMWFSDPFLSYLKAYGYCVIRLPKTDLKPLQIMAKNGKDLDRLGDLTTVLVAGSHIQVPKISENNPAANISGQRTSDISFGIGLSILGSFIGAMGGSKLGLDTKYQQAKTIAFEFNEVLEDKIDVAVLDQYLADADVNPFSRYVSEMLEADELYVTTAMIKSKKFTVEAKTSNGTSLQLNLPDIQGIVGGNVKVAGQSQVASKITYEGNVPLVFGFQAVRLFYEKSRYTAFEPLNPGVAMKALSRASSDGTSRLMPEGPFVRLIGD